MSDKHEAFVRLSEKRLETIEDAIRIWSNLSGPSYLFTIDEVMAGLARISTAATDAQMRFNESKCWRDQFGNPRMPEAAPEEPAEADPAPEAPVAPETGITPRQAEMLRIWDEATNEQGMLVEMLAMQREVIAGLQSDIEKMRSGEYGEILRNVQPVGRGRGGGRQSRGSSGVVPADADAPGSDDEADADA